MWRFISCTCCAALQVLKCRQVRSSSIISDFAFDSHTFCSECVRKFFLTKGSSECCPECKQRCTSSQLLSNRSLERIVMAFKKMKPKLLFFLEKIDLVNAIEEMQGNNNTKSTRNKEKNSDTKEELKRIPLTTYNFMKDKDVSEMH
jgi:hypothetical protein